MSQKRILIDGREFVKERKTGIARFLEGITGALIASEFDFDILLASFDENAVPSEIKNKPNLVIKKSPPGYLRSEKMLSDLSKQNFSLFISPYPKLPLFDCHCPAINTVHDVLDLIHPAYNKRLKAIFDSFRLRTALKKAMTTWYVSASSLKATESLLGFAGKNPKIRYNAIDERFIAESMDGDSEVIRKYGLETEYILVVGNGLPHKNLGILLDISNRLKWALVFAGVSGIQQNFWKSRYPLSQAVWITHVEDHDLPALIRGAFCLAQPSTAEGYGYPPLEAMACGVPVVVSDIPVLLETTGYNGLSADPDRPLDWLRAFKSLENPRVNKERRRLCHMWANKFRSPNGWEGHLNDILNSFK
jgi:glycosyltransferase involved in cell wall biosynthesis